jgi:RNA polymerase sigma-70 factor (ECF subfamily)
MSELSQEARALIDSVSKLDDPSPEDRARVKQRVALSLGAAAFAAVAVTQVGAGAGPGVLGTAKAGLWGTTGKLALCASVLGGALALGWPGGQTASKPGSVQRQPAETSRSEPAQPAAQLAMPAPSEAPAQRAMTAAPELAPPVSRERATQKPGHAASKAAREPVAPARAADPRSTLGLELSLLGDAQAALRAGQPERALVLAQEHQARFPSGVLREERLGIETLSECVLGRKEPARAQAFLRTAPESPLAARVRKACGLE